MGELADKIKNIQSKEEVQERFTCSYNEITPIHKIIPNPKNPNEHPEKQIKLLAKVIKYNGQRRPLIISKRTGFLVCGHGTLQALVKLGWKNAAVDIQDFTEEEELAHLLADNNLKELSKQNNGKVIEVIKVLPKEFDVQLLGLEDLKKLEDKQVIIQKDEDEIPDIETKKKVEVGHIYKLGNHYLMCGDSTMVANVEKLMKYSDKKANLIIADMFNYFPGEEEKKKQRILGYVEKIKDQIWNPALQCMAWASDEEASIYAFGYTDPEQSAALYRALYETGWLPRETIAWVKNKTIGGLYFKQKFDPIIMGVRKGKKAKFTPSGKYEVNVWEFDVPKSEHKFMKPTEIIEEMISHSLQPSEIVLDLFLGTGSTLIACEKTNNKCFGMELNPELLETAIRRWQVYSNQKAYKINGNKEVAFDEL